MLDVGTVLVVEDEFPIRHLISDLLRDEGYHVLEARDGAEAIHQIEEHLPPNGKLCIVVLDMMIPRVDGVGVLEHLAARGALIPVVAMSASSQHLRVAEEHGAQAILPKPFELEALLAVVARNCGRSE